ncbi:MULTISPECIES: hypothetical protein [Petrotoga]|uniref:Uncharacterized protein n=2 Tax=Petrotoga sibirica TaxID=156202 RepID=A0A4R8EU63_9BACT|nr:MULTISPECIES: hypothetical protein [Petrotoga]POZ87873.1 hypothetical protein AA80_09160 [Petrotoga sibirica DSM 13575]POZ89944.1 hypothetical protein AD60_09200 [Petrotoga sp. SL27]TDX16140.1 hypothetical protein C8D74_10594 [Petrotoga sibirica]
MKKTIFITTIILMFLNISVISFSQTSDGVNVPVYISVPSYAAIDSVDKESLEYDFDLSSPDNKSEEVKVKIVANTSFKLYVEFDAEESSFNEQNQALFELLNSSFNYSVDSNDSAYGVIEKTVQIGFNFQQAVDNDPEIRELLLKIGEYKGKVGNFIFTVSPAV